MLAQEIQNVLMFYGNIKNRLSRTIYIVNCGSVNSSDEVKLITDMKSISG